MTPAKTFLYFCLSFVGGIFIASFVKVPKLIIWELFVLGGFYLLIGAGPVRGQPLFRKAVTVFGLCLIILTLGILRTGLAEPPEELTGDGPLLAGLKQRFRETIEQNLSPPQSAILAAVVLGDKAKISAQWKEKLNIAGVRHITAISGMHIVILSQILIWLALTLGLYRGKAFWFTLIFLWLFIFFIGFQPSAVRAGIMGSLVLLAQKIGRPKSSGRLLIVAAAAMLLFKPSLLKESIGFQLSFLATLGIIYLMPFFKNLLEKFKPFKFFGLSSLLAMTLAAQVFTLPLLIYNFGYVSLASPFSNILIVPVLPYIMGGGFLFLISGLVCQPLAGVVSWPIFLLLGYLTSIVNFFSKIPWASLALQHLHWLWLLFCYLILAFFTWRLNRIQKQPIAFS